MGTLYDIIEEYREIERELIESGGDLTPELEERLAINRDEFETKMDAYAKLRAEATARKEMRIAEQIRISKLIDGDDRVIERLEERMKDALLQYGSPDKKGIVRLETATFRFSTRKSTGYAYNERAIPEQYWYTPPPPEPVAIIDKTKIKADLKEGKAVEGVTTTTNYSIIIK